MVASGAVIYDSTGNSSGSGTGFNAIRNAASLLTTGSTGTTVRTVGAWISSQNVDSVQNLTIEFLLADGTNGMPGTLVGTLSNRIFDADDEMVYCYDETGITLAASTDYWISLAPTSGTSWGSARTILTDAATVGMTGYEIIPDQNLVALDASGTTWSLQSGRGSYIYLLDTEVVPEPATMSLLAMGGLALLRRKRK